MLTKVEASNPNFGIARNMGREITVSGKAKRYAGRLGQYVVEALDTVVRENKIEEPARKAKEEVKTAVAAEAAEATGKKTFYQTIKEKGLFKTISDWWNRESDCWYADSARIIVKNGKNSASGQPTLALRYHRNVSGAKQLGYSTRELDLDPSKIADFQDKKYVTLNNLRDAIDNATKVADNAHDAWAIGDKTFVREGSEAAKSL